MKTIFVSSTFRDMQAERDAIREITAPLLNNEARTYGDEIDFYDLRWGIDTAELETDKGSRKVLEVCLDEIDRCKPPMIVLLGYRYGWIPDKSLIEDAAIRKNRQLESKELQRMQLEDLEISVTALEIEYGSLRDSERFSNTLFYFREIEGEAPSDYQSEDKEHAAKVQALKDRIRAIGGDRIRNYTIRWNGVGFDGVDDFAHMLANDIKTILLPQWEITKNMPTFVRERCTHLTFIDEKSSMFRARQAEADMLFNDINNNPVTIIKGAVGSGKSTLFCHLAKRFMQSEKWVVLPFISGLTNESNDAYDIIENTVHFIERALGLPHFADEKDPQTGQPVTHSIEEWRNHLAEMCAAFAESGNKLLIMLDGADQLTQSEARDNLYFIPMNTGASIHFAMTCTLDFKTSGREFYTIKQIDDDGKQDVITGTLSRAGRELSKPVVEKMVALKSSDNPLYLSLLVQRLLMMNSADFADIRARGDGMSAIEAHQIELIANNCPDDLDDMSAALLTEAGNRINSTLVSKVGQLLAVSRAGLRRHDLSELLGESWTDIDFSHFISYMNDCFMQRDDGRYDFTHKSIRAGFLKLCSDVDTVNNQILTYLKGLPENDPVRISEIVYHTIKADNKQFYIKYIIEHEYHNENCCITYAALDTYRKCILDNGEWICDVLSSFKLFSIDDNTAIFIDFINFDLNEIFTGTLEELKIQLRILKQNLLLTEYMDSQLATNSSKRELSVSYDEVANIYRALGGKENLFKALEFYQKTLIIREQLEKSTNTNESKRDLSVSCEYIAGIYKSLGGIENLECALELEKRALELRKQLDTELCTSESKSSLSLSYENTADIYEQFDGRENLEYALVLYNKSLEFREQLAVGLDTTDSRRNLSRTCNKVANIYKQLGGRDNLEHALSLYKKGLEIREWLAAELGTVQSRRDLSISLGKAADIYDMLGGRDNLEYALELCDKNIELSEQLADELCTAESRRDLSISYNRAALIYEELSGRENLEHALELYNKSYELRKQNVDELGTADSRRNMSVSCERIANIYKQFGGQENLEHALGLFNQCIEIYEQLADELGTAKSKRDLSVGYNSAAIIYEKLGGQENLERALDLYNKGLELREQLDSELSTVESRRDLFISYSNTAGIYEKLGGNENLKRSLELYEKVLEISEQLALELDTVEANNDLVLSLYNLAMHDLTSAKDRKRLLERALLIAEMLLDTKKMDRFQEYVDVLKEELASVDML